jgi:hypothetical protein
MQAIEKQTALPADVDWSKGFDLSPGINQPEGEPI